MYSKFATAILMAAPALAMSAGNNSFNPAISLVLQGGFASYKNQPDNYTLPGFTLGEEAGLTSEGFSLDESEITLGANVDPKFYGQMTFALADAGGETEVEIEEAYLQTLDLGNGLVLKAGRFYSAIGYLNARHTHTWNFADAPLIYRGLFGDQLKQDGVQLNWILPTDMFVQAGAELGNGNQYPAAGQNSGVGDWLLYLNSGGDIGDSHSWQAGISHWQANHIDAREFQGNNTPAFSGESQIDAFNFIYKWAPNGNTLERQLILQFEYFSRRENGDINLLDNSTSSSYDGRQRGGYIEAVYQFQQQWQAGLRYDRLSATNRGDNATVLNDAGLLTAGHDPSRSSIVLNWNPSEFSSLSLQFNRDQSSSTADNQVFLQYTVAIGAHGAHSY